jgi:hypothetical protein
MEEKFLIIAEKYKNRKKKKSKFKKSLLTLTHVLKSYPKMPNSKNGSLKLG